MIKAILGYAVITISFIGMYLMTLGLARMYDFSPMGDTILFMICGSFLVMGTLMISKKQLSKEQAP